MYLCKSDWFAQYIPVKYWIANRRSISPPKPPVSATGLESTSSFHMRLVCEECLFVRGETERVARDGNDFRYTRKAGFLSWQISDILLFIVLFAMYVIFWHVIGRF